MNLIVAVDSKWGIGYKGDLLFKFPEDMRRFIEITKQHGIVVMGRKTFESLKKPDGLPERINWVITRDPVKFKEKYPSNNVLAFGTIQEVISAYVKNRDEKNGTDVICIGGAEIYKELLPYCKKAFVTKINLNICNCDAYFPEDLDRSEHWRPNFISSTIKLEEDVRLTFWNYVRVGE